ncbi:MAG: HNH endonuclease [Deltaproteobacteria bacterium]|nr:HNH endonuclease [Deltaproteobacteria bacterium]
MPDYFISDVTEADLAKEKAKARELRASQWWKRKLAEGICHYCHRGFKPSELTMDHVVPIIRGGKSSKGNVVPCCKECNNKKKHMLPIEWQEYLEGLDS